MSLRVVEPVANKKFYLKMKILKRNQYNHIWEI